MRIEVRDIKVEYLIGDVKDIGLKDYIIRKLQGKDDRRYFKALDGVSFDLGEGDFCGVIGTNGAGKSTLMKVLSGIMRPSAGSVRVEGNVAALLELGSGFDGDMTVRENAYLRGAMLGYTEKYMNALYDDIIRFAELEEFQNTAFKKLSSGMKSRLAFSIACLVDPDILILDEVLAVGDAGFRKKSERKMMDIIEGGAITLLVSHSLAQVQSLCNKALWIEKGQQILFGDADDVCPHYDAYIKSGGKTLPEGIVLRR
ncbi:MAG: ABC transporter ATP-binding protein [Christensenellales bacterium]|jgi:ABC-2 type transport system ATP-binding protein